MRPAFAFLILVFLILFISITLGYGSHKQGRILQSFSFKPPFFPDAGTASVPGWEVRGAAQVFQDYIRLTPAEGNKSGFLTNRRPFFLKTIELTFQFRVHSHVKAGADGIALWMTDQPLKPGPLFGGPSTWNGIGILFDTFDNNGRDDHPLISIHYNDGTSVITPQDENSSTLIGFCTSKYRNAEKSLLHLYIEDDFVTIYIDALGNGDWKSCTSGPVKMPPRYFFSVSAATGGLFDNHDVYSLIVNTMDEKIQTPKQDQVPEELVMREKDLQQEKEKLEKIEKENQEKFAKLNAEQEKWEKEQNIPAPAQNVGKLSEDETDSQNGKGVSAADFNQLLQEIQESKKAFENLNLENQQLKITLESTQHSLEKRSQEINRIRSESDDKHSQITNLQILVKQLTDLRDNDKPATDLWKDCDLYQLNCTNLPALRRRFDNIHDEFVESFNHEIEEIRYLFADELRRVESFLAPFTSSATLINNEIRHIQYTTPQYQDLLKMCDSKLSDKSNEQTSEREIKDIIESLTLIQNSFTQVQQDERKLYKKIDELKDKLRKRKTTPLWTYLTISVLVLQAIVFIASKLCFKQRRSRNVLF